jgi:bisphosphoglycerate-independent phosphoglycerate mutase (AlkP superfamily)
MYFIDGGNQSTRKRNKQMIDIISAKVASSKLRPERKNAKIPTSPRMLIYTAE